jgi:aspartyl-tRNA(Asn)/glutamyl-tRNA(Gln) amidotransferase subunit A
MTDAPWTGDACSLVDAFRSGERHPVEELEATLAAIERSDLHAFSHVDAERARAAAADADPTLPFGGVPVGIKELTPVEGWPHTEASLVFAGRTAAHTSHHMQRLFTGGGVVPVGQTTASEFGGLNVSTTKINGVTHNPWEHGRTAGGSSGGSAAAVAGGLVSLASGGDGGGSIRIPAAYCGLLGMKGTFGRITRGPRVWMRPNTVVAGCLARSVRDAARYYDVCAGVDHHDPGTLESHGRWEADLGTHDLSGLRVAVVADLGGVTLDPGVEEHLRSEADALIAETGMVRVDLPIELPDLAASWTLGNLSSLLAKLGDRWPRCAGDMTDEMAIGLFLSQSLYNLHMAAAAEQTRIAAHDAMARAFDEVDLIIAATNPGPAFPADATKSSDQHSAVEWAMSSGVARGVLRSGLFGTRLASAFSPSLPARLIDAVTERFPDLVKMGALTIISNVYGNPAVSIPAGTVRGLPVGLQVLAPRHRDALLFDVALAVERSRPWPLIAPTALLPTESA